MQQQQQRVRWNIYQINRIFKVFPIGNLHLFGFDGYRVEKLGAGGVIIKFCSQQEMWLSAFQVYILLAAQPALKYSLKGQVDLIDPLRGRYSNTMPYNQNERLSFLAKHINTFHTCFQVTVFVSFTMHTSHSTCFLTIDQQRCQRCGKIQNAQCLEQELYSLNINFSIFVTMFRKERGRFNFVIQLLR